MLLDRVVDNMFVFKFGFRSKVEQLFFS
jgi:hypothetical protein